MASMGNPLVTNESKKDSIQTTSSQSLQPLVESARSTSETLGKRKPSRPPSEVWEHWNKLPCDNPLYRRASCKYCGNDYACGSKRNGTSALWAHLGGCKKYPLRTTPEDKRQKTLAFTVPKGGKEGESHLAVWKFEQELCREKLAKMIITDELPFKHVKGKGFTEFCSAMPPKFKVPGRCTITRDCYKLYYNEKKSLKTLLSKTSQIVCLTTDTWTSLQNLSYMCLTVHFIDNNWSLQKRILNFCPISGHTGEAIGRAVETCLIEWGIEKVFSVIVDNASSNDLAISYLKKRVNHWKGSIMNGDFFHMRCCAHIVNLIVGDGFREADASIARIRDAVKYVRASPSRLKKFKECVEYEKITSKSLVCLDITTRWNSTYLMLEAAVKFQKAFERMESEDNKFLDIVDAPSESDWEKAKVYVKFLKVFYDATLRFSGCKYVTSNSYLDIICGIEKLLLDRSNHEDIYFSSVAKSMKSKYDKYWGGLNRINKLLFIAAVLDPRYKMKYIKFCFDELYTSGVALERTKVVRSTLDKMYLEYSKSNSSSVTPPPEPSVTQVLGSYDDDSSDFMASKYASSLETQQTGQKKSEVDRYLDETSESLNDRNFDILKWRKINSPKYRILSLIARDVLAIPVSTVASESTFSMGGRILDSFRSSLTPRTVEALVCTEDWLRKDGAPIHIEESLADLERIESEILEGKTDVDTCLSSSS